MPIEVLNEIKLLEDSLTELGFKMDELKERKLALQLEKDMILKNKLSHGEGKSDSLAVLKQAMEFFRSKLTDINAQLARIKRNEQRIIADNTKTKARLADLKKYKNTEDPQEKYEPIHQVMVSVSADEAITCTVELSYMVTQAGWIPSYDLRSNATAAPVQLTYKANVFQSAGEEWNNVKLKLSTANPNRSNIKPELPTWYINYYTRYKEVNALQSAREESNENISMTSKDQDEAKKKIDAFSPAQSAANYSQLIETMSNVMFEINLPYNIPSDGANHVVSVKTSELPAIYYHYLVPKIESESFLLAKVTGWENLSLLPGKANVFYEGTYVGETVLNPAVINDTLNLAFGRDNGIMVTRTKLPVKESNKLIGNDVTKNIIYEIKMKNNKNKPLNLIVEDQVPVSQNKEIKIEVKETGKADYNTQTGLLKWNFSLSPKEYKTLSFSYAVTYNKEMPLSMF